ncbi:unnamed protein product [Blepharisma stoltei]|uniref:RING-type E3 ubiquitin transferase n=1 Tax=Blepharisma stoltei TaxID=1481888 RepID=A0AAU9K5A6_9CILI|nr:unnamed protein product [Blepharisma stoltei]
MLGYSFKSYICHNCQRVSLVDTSNLICPHCGNDFLEDTTTARIHQHQAYQYASYYCHSCRSTNLIDPHNPVCPNCHGTILEEASQARRNAERESHIPDNSIFYQFGQTHQYPPRQPRSYQYQYRAQRPSERVFFPEFAGFPSWNNSFFRDFAMDPFAEFESFFNGDFFSRRQERVLGRLFGDLDINPNEYFTQNFGSFDDIINLLIQRNASQTTPASESAINSLQKKIVEKGAEIQKCAVCMDDMPEGTEINVLSCNHMFHPDCIQPWLRVKNNCPVCRQEVR